MTDPPVDSPEQAAQPGQSKAPAKTYDRSELSVVWEAGRCLHTAACVRALPQVFDLENRPWITVDAAAADDVAAAVRACPTGALRYEAHTVAPEAPEETTTVRVSPNGPHHVRGPVTLVGPDGVERSESRVALCRCGATGNSPYCDNSHRAIGFTSGPLSSKDDQADLTAGPCRIEFGATGPYAVRGPARVVSPAGAVLASGEKVFLCRCGHSSNKPFCDGTHNSL